LRGFAFAQSGDLVAAEVEMRLAVSVARDVDAEHEVGLALDGLIRLAARGAAIDVSAASGERDEILARLGIGGRADLTAAPSWTANVP
jgi:hypothetical protein